jgi:hypothetical protein
MSGFPEFAPELQLLWVFSQEKDGFGNTDLVYAFAELTHLAEMRYGNVVRGAVIYLSFY